MIARLEEENVKQKNENMVLFEDRHASNQAA